MKKKNFILLLSITASIVSTIALSTLSNFNRFNDDSGFPADTSTFKIDLSGATILKNDDNGTVDAYVYLKNSGNRSISTRFNGFVIDDDNQWIIPKGTYAFINNNETSPIRGISRFDLKFTELDGTCSEESGISYYFYSSYNHLTTSHIMAGHYKDLFREFETISNYSIGVHGLNDSRFFLIAVGSETSDIKINNFSLVSRCADEPDYVDYGYVTSYEDDIVSIADKNALPFIGNNSYVFESDYYNQTLSLLVLESKDTYNSFLYKVVNVCGYSLVDRTYNYLFLPTLPLPFFDSLDYDIYQKKSSNASYYTLFLPSSDKYIANVGEYYAYKIYYLGIQESFKGSTNSFPLTNVKNKLRYNFHKQYIVDPGFSGSCKFFTTTYDDTIQVSVVWDHSYNNFLSSARTAENFYNYYQERAEELIIDNGEDSTTTYTPPTLVPLTEENDDFYVCGASISNIGNHFSASISSLYSESLNIFVVSIQYTESVSENIFPEEELKGYLYQNYKKYVIAPEVDIIYPIYTSVDDCYVEFASYSYDKHDSDAWLLALQNLKNKYLSTFSNHIRVGDEFYAENVQTEYSNVTYTYYQCILEVINTNFKIGLSCFVSMMTESDGSISYEVSGLISYGFND